MKIEHIRVVDLTPEQLARCRELSFGDEGYMCDDLEVILENEHCWRYRYSQTILLSQDDKIAGWALLQPVHNRPRYSAQLFVDEAYRGRGFGRVLMEQANRWGKIPFVYVDDENEGFFNRMPYLCERYDDEGIPA